MIPPLPDDTTFSGMPEFRQGVPHSRGMDRSSGAPITDAYHPLDQQTMDCWQYPVAPLGLEYPSTGIGVQQPKDPKSSSDAEMTSTMYGASFASYPAMIQQTNSSGETYGQPFPSGFQNPAQMSQLPSAQSEQVRFQPSSVNLTSFPPIFQSQGANYDDSCKTASNLPAAPSILFGNALNVATHPQPSAVPVSYPEDSGLSGLAQAQDFMTWINHDDNGKATTSSRIGTATSGGAATALSGFGHGQMPDQSIWQNSGMVSPGGQASSSDQMLSNPAQQFQHSSKQTPSTLQLQIPTSIPVPGMSDFNNVAMNANTTCNMQTQPDSQVSSDECMQMFLWSQEPYPQADEAAFSMSNQRTSISYQAQPQFQNTIQPEQKGLALDLNAPAPGRATSFAIPAPKEIRAESSHHSFSHKAVHSARKTSLPQAVAHQPAIIFPPNLAGPQPYPEAKDNSQFMAYAMPATINSAHGIQHSSMGKSEAYLHHSAIANKLEVLALEANTAHSAGIE